jgi:uncharacterized protein (TIGR00251 family)
MGKVIAAGVTIIAVKVKPNARASTLTLADDGAWLAQLKSPPVDGKANEELLRLVARHFACPRSAVSLKSGASARTKLVRIEGAGPILQNGAPPPQSRHEP